LSGPIERPRPYRLDSGGLYEAWVDTEPSGSVRLEVDWWLDGLYDDPRQHPSIGLGLIPGTDDETRYAVLPRIAVRVGYMIFENIRQVRLVDLG
jgi:hypothetical protein